MSATVQLRPSLEELEKKHYSKKVWARFITIVLGFWLLTSPFTFGYENPVTPEMIPQTGIGLKSVEAITHSKAALLWSDLITGVLVVLFGSLSFSYRRAWPSWIVCFLGIWLQFAPILFWSPDAVIYLNDTLVGALLIAFSILVPGLPFEGAPSGPDIPPGWSYNPSSWLQRIPVIACGFFGWFISRYLAAYQLGYTAHVWDPFFKEGTLEVITSALSRSFPISDAGLGAIAYALEALMGCKGSSRRWRTMPWMVIFFGILVVPLGFCSILLVMMQPIIVGAWCGLCLCTAAAMLIMIALTVDEVVAVLQVLKRAHLHREFWKVFWHGDHQGAVELDSRTPLFSSEKGRLKACFWGVCSIPWNLVLTALLGVALMFAPAYYGFDKALANNTHVFGALTITFSIIAWAEVTRVLRFLLIPIGLWVIASPIVLHPSFLPYVWQEGNIALIGVGFFLIVFSVRRGKVKEQYGEWNRWIV